jgi:hypothetical protein
MAGADWTDEENDAIVADYFAMLIADLSGEIINKSEHRERLRRLIARSEGSIEFKHRNISAVMEGFGEPWLTGYRPADNYQTSLEDAVARWFRSHPGWDALGLRPGSASGLSHLAEGAGLFFGPPPTVRNAPLSKGELQKQATARKFDVAGRDARNRALGQAGEELVLRYERSQLRNSGRSDLAGQIRWVSRDEGDGAGYDIASFEPDGRDRLIEVKTTNGWERTPFHISRNELAVADGNREIWCLVRLWNFAREPRAYEIRPPLDRHVELTPTSFQASPR